MDEEKIRYNLENLRGPAFRRTVQLMDANKANLTDVELIQLAEKAKPKKLSLEVSMLARDRSYGDSRTYRVNRGNDCVLKLTQVPFPECCGIAIFRNVSLSSSLSMDDFNTALDLIIDDLVTNDKFSKVLFYTTDSSKEARAFSAANNIVITDKFLNRRSTNYLIGFELDINPQKLASDSHNPDFAFEEPTDDDEYYSNDDLYDGDDSESSDNDHFRQEMASLNLTERPTQIENLYFSNTDDALEYRKVLDGSVTFGQYLESRREKYIGERRD